MRDSADRPGLVARGRAHLGPLGRQTPASGTPPRLEDFSLLHEDAEAHRLVLGEAIRQELAAAGLHKGHRRDGPRQDMGVLLVLAVARTEQGCRVSSALCMLSRNKSCRSD